MTDFSAVRRACFRLAALALLLMLLPACATEDPLRQKRPTDRKWYQGDMDSGDRTFFVDSFFNGR